MAAFLMNVMALPESQTPARLPVIIDTDFAAPPQDDGLALLLALQSLELEILGVTTVAGNYSVERANVDVLRVLEIAGHTNIPVHSGADMPLVHEPSDYARAFLANSSATALAPKLAHGGMLLRSLQSSRSSGPQHESAQ